MDTTTLQIKILEKLFDPTQMDADELASQLDVDIEKVQYAIYTLSRRGLVDTVMGAHTALMTTKGYDYLEEMKVRERTPSQTVNINAPVFGSAIAVGGSQATVENNGTMFFNELQRQIEQASLPEEEKSGLIEAVKKLSQHPLVATAAGAVLSKFLGY